MQEQAFLDELEQLGLLEIEDSVKWKCTGWILHKISM